MVAKYRSSISGCTSLKPVIGSLSLNTLICTFPLSFQNTDYHSEIGYADYQELLKENTVKMVIKQWNRYYKFLT